MFYELSCHVWNNISVTIIEFGEREMTYDFLLVFVLVFDFLCEFDIKDRKRIFKEDKRNNR